MIKTQEVSRGTFGNLDCVFVYKDNTLVIGDKVLAYSEVKSLYNYLDFLVSNQSG